MKQSAVLVLEDGRSFRGEAYGAIGETFGEGLGLFETTPLQHGAAPLFEEGGSATGVLITDECHGPCGDGQECTPLRGASP